MPAPHIFLDTDIGSDIDDALALLLLLHLPDVELLGLTTVYGQVRVRARIARRILDLAGRAVPVAAGCGLPWQPAFPVWHTGMEGVGILDSGRELPSSAPPGADCDNAVSLMTDCVLSRPGKVTLIAIGALTNVAMAMDARSEFAQAVAEIVFMGAGATYPEKPPESFSPDTVYHAGRSHNVGCDVAAAQRVFASRVPIRVLTNDVTTQVWWDGEPVQRLIRADQPPEVAAVGRLMRIWLEYRSGIFGRPITGTCTHDPLTVAEAVFPSRFVEYCHGWIQIRNDGSSSFCADRNGPHRVGYRVAGSAFLRWMADRILPGRAS